MTKMTQFSLSLDQIHNIRTSLYTRIYRIETMIQLYSEPTKDGSDFSSAVLAYTEELKQVNELKELFDNSVSFLPVS